MEVESKVNATAKANKTRKGKRVHVICITKTRRAFAPHRDGPHPGSEMISTLFLQSYTVTSPDKTALQITLTDLYQKMSLYFAVGCLAAALSFNLSTSGASAAFAAGISSLLLASFRHALVSPLNPR